MSSAVPELLRGAAETLRLAGVDSPRTDAELLLAHVLGISRTQLLTRGPVTPEQAAAFARLVDRRRAREPLQHLVGTAAFRHLELAVGPGVFVPRPETELLVDAVLPTLRARPNPLVVDLCSGSGALGLSIAHELPGSLVIAVERSPEALRWLQLNADGRIIDVVAADVADPELLGEHTGTVDAVVSNPPYVPAATPIGAEVRHDPAEAVFAGADGLDLMPAVIATAARLLRPGGFLAIEHDDTHGAAVPALLAADGRWAEIADHDDLAGRPRFVTAVRAG